jgi:hypothetical protein
MSCGLLIVLHWPRNVPCFVAKKVRENKGKDRKVI